MIDVKSKKTDELKLMVGRYKQAGRTADPVYKDMLEELRLRRDDQLDIDLTTAFIRQNARQSKYVSYGSVVEDQGKPWTAKAQSAMFLHLDEVGREASRRGWPLLPAIVVLKENVVTGKLEGKQREGFLKLARELDYAISDEDQFVRDQQQQVFAWALRDA